MMDTDGHGSANLSLWEHVRGFEQDLRDKLARSVSAHCHLLEVYIDVSHR